GRHFLYYVTGVGAEANGIYVASLEDDAQTKRLLPDSTVARYVPSGVPDRSGYLLFVRETTLMAQPFDADTVTLTGRILPLADSPFRRTARWPTWRAARCPARSCSGSIGAAGGSALQLRRQSTAPCDCLPTRRALHSIGTRRGTATCGPWM